MADRWIPPTPTPQAGQGPWCDSGCSTFWLVAETPEEAVRVVRTIDADTLPDYFGWKLTVEPTVICWVEPDDWNEENEIEECYSTAEDGVEAWKLTVEDA